MAIEIAEEQCIMTTGRDISRLKQTERELIAAREAALAASHAKSEFLSSMSHEIRTPMNAILGMGDLLAETPLTAEQLRYVDIMTANGNVLLDLINAVLDLAKMESGKLNLETTSFDLNELAERVADTLGIRAHEKHLELGIRILPDVPEYLVGDPLRLRQVLTNLIGNAVKFTQQGEVVLTIENDPESKEPGGLRFTVSDTGIDIPSDRLEAVFQSFSQVDSSTTRRYGGSGLGLAIVKRLVELMGGRIRVESEPGEGSTFEFTARFGVSAEPVKLESSVHVDLNGVGVLVVDDNDTNRLIIREILAKQGAVIGEANCGEDALAELRRARNAGKAYQLVLLDCRMPGMDGFEVAERIRHDPGGGDPVVLMLTSDDLHPKLARMGELGLDVYLVKPIKRSELLEVVAAVLGKAKAGKAKSVPSRATEAGPEGRPLKVLLAEDSPDNCLLIQAYLKDTPHQLDAAENGETAVAKFTAAHYDAVLMDVQMPVMDGYTAVRKIRRWEHEHGLEPTPIIALTASALEQGIRESREAGCTGHLSKPIKKKTLLDALSDVALAHPPANGKAGADHIVVKVDPELKELIPGFLARKREDLNVIQAAFERRDYSALATLGHRIKGEGSGFGFEALSAMGKALEQASVARDAQTVRKQVQALSDYLNSVQIELSTQTATAGHNC
jgi:CheY-like chemotaxis protein/nitrogen-specific signal transduction histidine kinase